jgi:hypothetical protein
LVLVPLIGLECDQVAKGFHIDQWVKACNLDEHQGNDHILLRNCLLSTSACLEQERNQQQPACFEQACFPPIGQF